MSVLAICGSPSATSRTQNLLDVVDTLLAKRGLRTEHLSLRSLPPNALLRINTASPLIREAISAIGSARIVVIGTPIYKAAYSGLLKAFLDLLPRDALADKIVLPVAAGGSGGHLLAIDYALRPVLHALGANHILPGVFATEDQVEPAGAGEVHVDGALHERLDHAAEDIWRRHVGPPLHAVPQPTPLALPNIATA